LSFSQEEILSALERCDWPFPGDIWSRAACAARSGFAALLWYHRNLWDMEGL